MHAERWRAAYRRDQDDVASAGTWRRANDRPGPPQREQCLPIAARARNTRRTARQARRARRWPPASRATFSAGIDVAVQAGGRRVARCDLERHRSGARRWFASLRPRELRRGVCGHAGDGGLASSTAVAGSVVSDRPVCPGGPTPRARAGTAMVARRAHPRRACAPAQRQGELATSIESICGRVAGHRCSPGRRSYWSGRRRTARAERRLDQRRGATISSAGVMRRRQRPRRRGRDESARPSPAGRAATVMTDAQTTRAAASARQRVRRGDRTEEGQLARG
jgi:hypothetical protein